MDRYGGASTEYLYIYLHNQSKSISAPSTKVISKIKCDIGNT